VIVRDPSVFECHRLKIPTDLTLKGLNKLEIIFESEYAENSEGLYYYEDFLDEEEYVYTDCAPSHCHYWFPCFD
jgi:aminopeptidase N